MNTRTSTVRRSARASQRGFTLIELLVASVAGLLVVLAAFLISRGATKVFASEGRVANAQLNLRLGVDRLRQDLERAGYMTTPNVRVDPDSCPDPNSLGFAARLQSVYHEPGTPARAALNTPPNVGNLLYPDAITLSGNYASSDSYLASTIEPSSGGAGHDIYLQVAFGSTARLMAAGETSSPAAAVSNVFAEGRMLRIRNDLGSSQFVVIQGATIDAAGRPTIKTAPLPAYTTVGASSVVKRCGGRGICLGCEISPVSFVRYEIRSLEKVAGFAWAYPATGMVADSTKYDLVRSEVKPDGTPIPNTEEIVSEFAVDMAFAFTVDSSPALLTGTWTEPQIEELPFGSPRAALFAGDTLAAAPGTVRPQSIRSIRYRLATRSRFADYPVGLEDGGPGISRYMLQTGQYARVRTVFGEVPLVNQQGLRW